MATQCKHCGHWIDFFARNVKTNKLVPLVRATHLFEIDWDPVEQEYRAHKVEREIYVSHFRYCARGAAEDAKESPQTSLF